MLITKVIILKILFHVRSTGPFFTDGITFKSRLRNNNPRIQDEEDQVGSSVLSGAVAHRHTYFNPKFKNVKLVRKTTVTKLSFVSKRVIIKVLCRGCRQVCNEHGQKLRSRYGPAPSGSSRKRSRRRPTRWTEAEERRWRVEARRDCLRPCLQRIPETIVAVHARRRSEQERLRRQRRERHRGQLALAQESTVASYSKDGGDKGGFSYPRSYGVSGSQEVIVIDSDEEDNRVVSCSPSSLRLTINGSHQIVSDNLRAPAFLSFPDCRRCMTPTLSFLYSMNIIVYFNNM